MFQRVLRNAIPSFGALFVLVAATAAPAAAQSLDEILAKHFEAQGGKEKIAAVQTVKIVAKQVAGPQTVPLTIYWKRPDKVRIEINYQGMTGVQAYDGKDAWMVMPFLGKNDPEAMTGDDLKEIVDQADLLEGALFNWKEKGHSVELVGEESVEGTPAWKLKLVKKNGDASTIWLDKEAYLQIKSEGKRKRGDQEIEMESSMGDYKEVGGLLFPFSSEARPKGAPQGMSFVMDKIELDVAVEDALFAMPAKPAAPAVAPAGGKG